MIESLKKLRQYLLTGVSYAIPFIACGGIMVAIALAFTPLVPGEQPDPTKLLIPGFIFKIGKASFSLMFPVLAGFIAYAIASKPGLVPGFVGGFLCDHIPTGLPKPVEVSAGFLGAIVAGLLAGWIVQLIKKVPVSKYIKPIMPILIIPIVSSTVIGVLMLFVFGPPIAYFFKSLEWWLGTMSTGNTVVLALILGAMIAFDMGGPVNKAAFFFGSAMIAEKNYAIMGACAAAICTPPLGLGLATLINRKLWTQEEREAGGAALAMGMIGITEGAIPFAAADPLRVIPCIMAGSMVASTISMLAKVGDRAPHGGPIVLPVVDNRVAYVFAILAGTIVTALAINITKVMTSRKSVENPSAQAVGA